MRYAEGIDRGGISGILLACAQIRSGKPQMHHLLDGVHLAVFDLDGTLVDSVPDLAAAVDAALQEVALPVAGEAKVRDWVGNGSRVLIERALADALGEEPGEAFAAATHEHFLRWYASHPCQHTRLYPGALEAIKGFWARGIPQYIVTNKPEAFVCPILETLGINGYFEGWLGGDSLSRRKPDPAPLLHVSQRFGVEPAQAVMIGDSRHDIAAGRAAGFRTVAVPYGYNHGEPVAASQPDLLVESLAQLV